MSRKIKVPCKGYSSKTTILREWKDGLDEGTLAVGEMYIPQGEIVEHYGFTLSEHGLCRINEIEAETAK